MTQIKVWDKTIFGKTSNEMGENLSKIFKFSEDEAIRQQQLAMRLSLLVGVLMLLGKLYAYFITQSSAILSDAAESIVHVFAVSFAAFSLWLSRQPADKTHHYGHGKISFFSAGLEGILIVLAAAFIIYEAVMKWVSGLEIRSLNQGIVIVALASLVNAALGFYLIWQGKRHESVILIANGKHVLTDFWTSLGVILGLLLVLVTGWLPFDPIIAVVVAVNILWSGSKLMRKSFGGLMDESDPQVEAEIKRILDQEAANRNIRYHQLRHRSSGKSLWIDLHLLFPRHTTIEQAHWQATEIEAAIRSQMNKETFITSHLEPAEKHTETHQKLKNSGD